MNNLRLLAGLLCTALLSGGVRGYAATVMTLEELFDIAENHSAELRPSLTARTEAERAVAEARAERLPDISAGLSLSYIGDGFTTRRDFSDYQKAPIPHLGTGLSVLVSQPVYAGGAITAGIELAELKSTSARYAAELSRDNIRFRLTGFYLDIYKYTNLRKVVESNIAAAEQVLEDIRARHSQGMALQNDITRYELVVAELRLNLVRISNTLEILNNNLVETAGLPEGTVIEPDTTILMRSLPLHDGDWWRNQSAESAPSMRLARLTVDISRKAEHLVRAERLPKIGLQAGWSFDGPILTEIPPINRNLSYWFVGVGISYNLSSLYKTNKSLARSRAATQKALDELDSTSKALDMAVRADHVRYLEAYEVLRSRDLSVELALSNYRTVATRYNAGMALITDMLDAANARIDAEQQLVNASIDIIYYYYKLLFTSGQI